MCQSSGSVSGGSVINLLPRIRNTELQIRRSGFVKNNILIVTISQDSKKFNKKVQYFISFNDLLPTGTIFDIFFFNGHKNAQKDP